MNRCQTIWRWLSWIAFISHWSIAGIAQNEGPSSSRQLRDQKAGPSLQSSRSARAGSKASCEKNTSKQRARLYLKPGLGKEPSFGLTAVLSEPGKITPSDRIRRYEDLNCVVLSSEEKETYRCQGKQAHGAGLRITLIKEEDSFRVVWEKQEKNQSEFQENDWGKGFRCDFTSILAQMKTQEESVEDTAGAIAPAEEDESSQPLSDEVTEPLEDVVTALKPSKKKPNRRLARDHQARSLRDADPNLDSEELQRFDRETATDSLRIDGDGNFIVSESLDTPEEPVNDNGAQ